MVTQRRRQNQRKVADALFASIVRARGPCEARHTTVLDNGCSGAMQCAHIQSRRYLPTRWDHENAIPLCQAHHFWFGLNPLEWIDWIDEHRPTGYSWLDLKHRAQADAGPVDYKTLIPKLRAELENATDPAMD